MRDIDYDAWKTADGKKRHKFICKCDYCGEEIYAGDMVVKVLKNGDVIHDDCFKHYANWQLECVLRDAGDLHFPLGG